MVDENQLSQNGSRSTTPNVVGGPRQVRSNRSTTPTSVASKYGYSTQSLNSTTMENNNTVDYQPEPKCVDLSTVHLDSYEKERLMFIAYIQSHPDVVASLGIIIPSHIKDKYPMVARMKVELKEVLQQPTTNGYHAGENGFRCSSQQYLR